MKLRHPLMLLGMLGAGGFMRKYRKGFFEMAGVHSAIYMLRAVKTVRLTAIASMYLVISVLFFIAGAILLHCALFTFLEGKGGAGSWTFLTLGLLEVSGSVGYMVWFFSSDRWLKTVSNLHPTLKKLWGGQS